MTGLKAPSARAHTLHTYTQPRETQRAAPRRRLRSPRAGGDPHPALAHPIGAGAPGQPRARGAQRRDARPAPPGAPAVTLGGSGSAAPGRPLRQRRIDARPAPATRAEPPPRRWQAPAEDRAALSLFLPSSGSWAQAALIPALKLNTRAARRPPGRRREAAAATGKLAGQRQGTPPPPTAAPSPGLGGGTRVALQAGTQEHPRPRFQRVWAPSCNWRCRPSKATFLKCVLRGTARVWREGQIPGMAARGEQGCCSGPKTDYLCDLGQLTSPP